MCIRDRDTLTVKRDNTLDDVDTDYKYQRENFYNLIERGQDAIDGILEVAKQSDHPRSYEVAGNLISQVADITEKLGKLQSAMKRLKEVPNSAPKNVTNALYVGCLLYTSPRPRDKRQSRMPSSA